MITDIAVLVLAVTSILLGLTQLNQMRRVDRLAHRICILEQNSVRSLGEK